MVHVEWNMSQVKRKFLSSFWTYRCAVSLLMLALLRVSFPATAADFQEPEMVLVPAGTFTMGTPSWADDPTWFPRIPQRRVSIDRSFWVGKYEVTRAEYQHCVEDGACPPSKVHRFSAPTDLVPITYINLKKVQAYTDWLSKKSGKKYRLLTGIEWEYAARGGETGLFSTGTYLRSDQANFSPMCSPRSAPRWRKRCLELQGVRSSVSGRITPELKPVGSYPPNRYALHDVHGNASELVSDCIVWDEDQKKPISNNVWQIERCNYAFFMGGYFELSVHGQRFDYVLPTYIDTETPHGGFRLAMDQ